MTTQLNTKTCTTEGSAQVPFIAKGWVWFEYTKKIDGHYWCAYRVSVRPANKHFTNLFLYTGALNTEYILSDKERSLYMSVDSVIGSETKSAYKAVCK